MYPPVYRGARIWGIRLWPDAIKPVLGVQALDIRDHFGALPASAAGRLAGLSTSVPDSDDPDVVFSSIDGWMSALVVNVPEVDARVRAAIREIVARRGEGSLQEVASAAAIGLRQLQRLFPGATGLTLREYARVRRLREALALRLAPDAPHWSAIAADTGFVDHSHLTREFVALAGVVPSRAESQLRLTAHQRVRP